MTVQGDTNVADNGVVAHVEEVLWSNDALASRGGDKDVSFLRGLVHRRNLVPCIATMHV